MNVAPELKLKDRINFDGFVKSWFMPQAAAQPMSNELDQEQVILKNHVIAGSYSIAAMYQ
jgi:hypothetical protein